MERVSDIITGAKNDLDAQGGLRFICFVACGGSLAAAYPSKYLLECESETLRVGFYNSNEFVHATPKVLGKNSLVVAISTKATPETVEALRTANKHGAVTVGLTGYSDSLTAATAKYAIVYNHQDEWNTDPRQICTNSQSMCLRLAFEVLYQFEGYGNYEKALQAFEHMSGIYESACKQVQADKVAFAMECQDDTVFNVIASGPLYATAYIDSFCYLQEMQQRHSITVHSGEYFHGPFETTDKELPILLMMAVGSTRPLDERVLSFLNRFAERVTVLDAAKLGLSALDESVAEYFNTILISPLSKRFVQEMADIRKHPMTYRRYMWKMDY